MTEGARSQHQTRLRIAIVGGGIGGLSLSTFLSTLGSSQIDSEDPSLGSHPDLEINIYEAAPSLTELGAGVGIWLRTWRILNAVSNGALAEDLKGIAPRERRFSDQPQKAFEFRRGDISPEGQSFHVMEVPFGVLTLHRADFQHVLGQYAIPPALPHFSKRLAGYTYTDENDLSSQITLKFTDGSTAQTDLLVGADGIRSVVRREVVRRLTQRGASGSLLSEPVKSGGKVDARTTGSGNNETVSELVEPAWSGTIVYRNLIPLEKLEERFPGHRAGRGPVVYFGKNQHVIAFPICSSGSGNSALNPTSDSGSSGITNSPDPNSPTQTPATMVNLVAFVSDPSREGTKLPPGEPWVRLASKEEVLGRFGGWEEEVLALIELAEKPLAWAIHTIKPLPTYCDADGRVVLLGDAAHAMTPHQGAGGGQAIEDAYVLASLLAHPRVTRETLPAALRAYDAVRVPISQRVVRRSRANGMMYELNLGWEEKDESDGSNKDADEEVHRLRKLANAIMEIHKWEWEDENEGDPGRESGKGQCELAVRLFEESLGGM